MNTIYRDDDVNIYTDAFRFKELHKQFIAKNQVHTVVVIMKDLWENHALFWYLATAPLLEIALHGWEHKHYGILSYEKCYLDLQRALLYWKENSDRMIGSHKEIKIFFSPWNEESHNIREACKNLGLRFCNVKKGEWEGNQIHSFHWWYAVMSDNFSIEKI